MNPATRHTAPKFVYFIKPLGMDGPIKIGCSWGPISRTDQLNTWSPFPLEIIGTVKGAHAHEAYLHQRFSDQHSHGEWFRSSPLLLRTIARILAGETIESACAGIPVIGPIQKDRRRTEHQMRQRKYVGLSVVPQPHSEKCS